MKAPLFDQSKGRRTRETRIWATQRLLSMFNAVPDVIILGEPKRPVELRKRGTDKLLRYSETRFTREANARLKQANRINRAAEIIGIDDVGQSFRLQTNLRAISLDKFTLYGRLHTAGVWHIQGLSRELRRTVTINGQTITELDYIGLTRVCSMRPRGSSTISIRTRRSFGTWPYPMPTWMPGLGADGHCVSA